MRKPPRAVESILKSLGADPYLADVVLGDLTEEFDERAAFDGEEEARRWYRSEALRSTPHLLRSAFGRLRVGDIPRLIGNALFAWLALLPLSLMVWVIVGGLLRLLGIEWSLQPTPRNPGFTAFVMFAMTLSGLIGGYVAAWRNSRAPLIGAASFGVVLTSINLVAGSIAPSPLHTSYRIAALAMFNIWAIVGGLIRATRLKPSAASVLSTP
jgi:hypothetical protein